MKKRNYKELKNEIVIIVVIYDRKKNISLVL